MFIHKPIAEVFAFFSKPENLAVITPKNLGLKILTPSPIHMRTGALIDYKIRVAGQPVGWTSLITSYEPPHSFVDEQVKGPYALWRHNHLFYSKGDGTSIRDEVDYAAPLGFLGVVARYVYVKRSLENIFEYREKSIKQIFE